ncbi:MAG: hypothetical protein NC935_01635 [Candidatus Omnitrophica bacterium]|nr:hypothetical protein [Candidatus Omnitrophota bacterium]
MDIKEAKEDFIKSLRVALNCALIYFKEHPLVKNSIEDLSQKIKVLSNFSDTIEISITPSNIFLGKEPFARSKLNQELAELFHFRKLKKIIFDAKRLTSDELISFIYILAKPPKEIFKEGGVEKLIKINEITNILVEELDYSYFLEGDGEKYKDIWEAILADTTSNKDMLKTSEFISIFDKVLERFTSNLFIQNDTVREKITNFLKYIKEVDRAKSLYFSKKIFHIVISDKDILQHEFFYKLKELFEGLKTLELVDILYEEIVTNNNFDQKSFVIFFDLFDVNTHKEVASLLKTKLKDLPSANLFIKKFKNLFFDNNTISGIYQPLLLSLSKGISPNGQISLDHNVLLKNYHFILLYLLDNLKSQKKIDFIFEQLIEQTKFFIEKKEFKVLENLLVKLEQRKNFFETSKFEEFKKRLGFELEEMAIKGSLSFDNIFLLDKIRESKYDFLFYLNLIFGEIKINPSILYLFFKLHKNNKQLFYTQLNKYKNNIKFLLVIIDNLSYIDLPESFEAIKYVFFLSNNFIKHKALDALEKLSIYDKDFFYSLLKSSDIYLKKTAFRILAKEQDTKKEAVKILLSIFNPFGIRNKVLLENLKLIEEMPLSDIREDLIIFSKKIFFNRTIAKRIKKIIKS